MATEMLTMHDDSRGESMRESRSGDGDRPWRTNEKLALMHAVLKHGDQAWVAVSRALRAHFAQEERHQAVFSPKRCAEVHAELVDSDPKKLKRTGPVSDEVLKTVAERLAGTRMKELKRSLKDKEKLARQYTRDISMIQSGRLDSQLQSIINEPTPNFTQAALALHSSSGEKKRSKKARVETATTPTAAPITGTPKDTAITPTTKLTASSTSMPSPAARSSRTPLASSSSNLLNSSLHSDSTPSVVPMEETPTALTSPAPSSSLKTCVAALPPPPSPSPKSTKLTASSSGAPLPSTPASADEIRKKQREPLYKVLQSMEKRGPHAQFFQHPVSLEDAPEYDEVIKQRMDFSQPVYGVWEFYRDMILIFTNALTYNETGSLVYTVAGQMKRALEKEMEPLLAEAKGKNNSSQDGGEKEATRRSTRVKEERKWHDE